MRPRLVNPIALTLVGLLTVLYDSHGESSLFNACIRVNVSSPHHATIRMDLLRLHCTVAVQSVIRYPWASDLSEIVVLNDVFPYTVVREPPIGSISTYVRMHQYIKNILSHSGCESVGCVVQTINRGVWNITEPPIIYGAGPPIGINSYGVDETIQKTSASCTGLSVFLVTALRMAAIPARIAGVLHWKWGRNVCPLGDASPECGNHSWVEVYDPSLGWSFVDQRRIDLQSLPLNSAWFYPYPAKRNTTPFSRNYSIRAASFLNPTFLIQQGYPVGDHVFMAEYYPMAWDWGDRSVYGWDVSASYNNRQASESAFQLDESK